jgi:hypothetical protein
MRSVVVSMCVFLGTLRIAQPVIWFFDNILAGRPVPETHVARWRIMTRREKYPSTRLRARRLQQSLKGSVAVVPPVRRFSAFTDSRHFRAGKLAQPARG